jgi:hypothetical protein
VLPGTSFSALRNGIAFPSANDISSMKVTPALAKSYNNAPAIAPQVLSVEIEATRP